MKSTSSTAGYRTIMVLSACAAALAGLVIATPGWKWHVVWDAAPYLAKGLATSWLVSIASILLGGPLAIALAAARISGPTGVRQLSIAYIEIIRALPQIMVIFWVFFSAPAIIGTRLEPWPAAILALTLIASAYLAEVIRAGLSSVPKIQRESAYVMGFGQLQTFLFVVLPQALRNMLPALIAHAVMMFKITSLVYVIGVVDFFRAVILVNNREFAPYSLYVTMGLVYFTCNYLLGRAIKWLDPKYTLAS